MLQKWFLVTIKFTRQFDEATSKAVSEQVLIHAINFTDAEAQANKYMECLIKDKVCIGEFDIHTMAKKDYREVYSSESEDCNVYFESKVIHTIFDEEFQKERTSSDTYLVQSESIDLAYATVNGMMGDGSDISFDIDTLKRTKVTAIIAVRENKEEKVED